MQAWYQIKGTRCLGCAANDDEDKSVLNRLVRWKSDSIEVEADSTHRLLIMEHFGLEEDSNVLTAPAIKEDVGEDEGKLTNKESTGYRRVAARGNYLTVDRADIQFAVKEACRGMSKPGEDGLRHMKRLPRHLKCAKAVTVVGSSDPETVRYIVVYVGSDWAGCMTSRKSTRRWLLTVERDAREVGEFDSSHCGDFQR